MEVRTWFWSAYKNEFKNKIKNYMYVYGMILNYQNKGDND